MCRLLEQLAYSTMQACIGESFLSLACPKILHATFLHFFTLNHSADTEIVGSAVINMERSTRPYIVSGGAQTQRGLDV